MAEAGHAGHDGVDGGFAKRIISGKSCGERIWVHRGFIDRAMEIRLSIHKVTAWSEAGMYSLQPL